ncbi:FAD-dependent monooxygenase [Nocardia sp. NPDC055029]
MTGTVDVLVVGAGPTGLTLATELRRHGISCRIIDRAANRPADQARALTMWDGALDVLARQGTAEAVRSRGIPMTAAKYFSGGKVVAQVPFGPAAANSASPVIITQPSVESAMIENLRALGVIVQWQTELTELTDNPDSVEATLTGPGGVETLSAQWVVGCDGTHSAVRTLSGIDFQGSTYEQRYTLGDGDITAPVPPGEAHYHLHPDGVLVVVPLPDGQVRVFADATQLGDEDTAPSTADLQKLVDVRAPYPIKVRALTWSTRFLVHMRHAERFRSGRCLLAGDAAHVHSPAGGQGLNTGIQDAANLGWKLAAVLHGGVDSAILLDSYAAERAPIAQQVITAADRQTRLWTVRSRHGRWARDLLLSTLSRTGLLEKRLVPGLAQFELDYRESPIVGSGGGRRGLGRAVPNVEVTGPDGVVVALRSLLDAPGHTLLVVVGAQPSAQDAQLLRQIPARIAAYRIAIQVLVLAAGEAGLEQVLPEVYHVPPDFALRDELAGCALVLIRPDGYVADATPSLDVDALLNGLPGVLSPEEKDDLLTR